jgi:hypothetical protein
MDKTIYSFKYNSEIFNLLIDRQKILVEFPIDLSSTVRINRINMQSTVYITPSNIVIEEMESGEYLTADGLLININLDSYEVLLTFIEEGFSLLTKCDGSIILTLEDDFIYYGDDRDLTLRPKELKIVNFENYFLDSFKYSINKSRLLSDGNTINSTFIIKNVEPSMAVGIGEFIGTNNKYNIVVDGEIAEEEPISIVIPDYNYKNNNLDTIFS